MSYLPWQKGSAPIVQSRPLVLWAFLAGLALPACAQEQGVLDLVWENDTFAQIFGPYTDKHYTDGAYISFLSRDNEIAMGNTNFLWSETLMSRLWNAGMTAERTKWGVIVGQDMYTPTILATGPSWYGVGYGPNATSVQLNDRPYAGWLYIGAQFQRRGRWGQYATKDDLSLKLGVVGPYALGDEAQTWFHSFFSGAIKPEGWGNQLKNEPGLLLHAQRNVLFTTRNDQTCWGLDFIPGAGFNLGNVSTRAMLTSEVRFGYALPRDFAIPGLAKQDPEADAKFSFYGFAEADGWLVAHDIFLDGNTYQSSHCVDKNPAVAELKLGLGLRLFTNLTLLGTYVRRTQEFVLQQGDDTYLSGCIKITF